MKRFPGLKEVAYGDRAEYSALFILSHYFPNSVRLRERMGRVRLRVAAQLRRQGPGKVFPVARVASLSPAQFRAAYLATGTPVVLEGGARDWMTAQRWSFEEFRRRFGQETIKLVQREGLTDDDVVFEKEYSEELPFGEFLDQTLSGGRKYMRFSPLLEQFPELLEDLDHDFFLRMTGSRWGQIYQMFIGGEGTVTPMHNAMSPFFFLNVRGVKHWTFVANRYLPVLNPASDGVGYNHSGADFLKPDLEKHPGLDSVDRLEARLGPGDLMYVPSWLWHSVRNEQPTIGLRCGFVNARNIVRESATLAFTRVFAARNPTMLEALYLLLVKKDLSRRTKHLVSPGLIRK